MAEPFECRCAHKPEFCHVLNAAKWCGHPAPTPSAIGPVEARTWKLEDARIDGVGDMHSLCTLANMGKAVVLVGEPLKPGESVTVAAVEDMLAEVRGESFEAIMAEAALRNVKPLFVLAERLEARLGRGR